MPQEIWPTVPKTVTTIQPIKTPPPPHMVRVYARDGSSVEVYPIDAKEIVAGGEYSYVPPAVTPPATEGADDQNRTDLDSRKKDELVELAESKGIDAKGMTKADLIEALTRAE